MLPLPTRRVMGGKHCPQCEGGKKRPAGHSGRRQGSSKTKKSAPRLPLVHVTRTPIMKQEPLELGVCVKREPQEPGVCVLHEPLAKVHSEVWAEQLGKKQDDECKQLRETCQTRVEEVCKKHDDEMEQLCQTHRRTGGCAAWANE